MDKETKKAVENLHKSIKELSIAAGISISKIPEYFRTFPADSPTPEDFNPADTENSTTYYTPEQCRQIVIEYLKDYTNELISSRYFPTHSELEGYISLYLKPDDWMQYTDIKPSSTST